MQFMVQYRICPGLKFCLLTILLRFQRASVLACWTLCTKKGHRVHNKDKPIGLMINAGLLLATSRRLTFGEHVIAFVLIGKGLSTDNES